MTNKVPCEPTFMAKSACAPISTGNRGNQPCDVGAPIPSPVLISGVKLANKTKAENPLNIKAGRDLKTHASVIDVAEAITEMSVAYSVIPA
ncbi:hypothetical protein GCM10011309_06970 [Litorimonas cladophorae]|uniref:Uncharacterized protein n=1 Tax=Litorimonas cladophorae TaxID=1220491 RepID=A0A918NDG6_9PROT|nr:hypothetical protein GCM10011309_06970 [Litorimonas cladophorae]